MRLRRDGAAPLCRPGVIDWYYVPIVLTKAPIGWRAETYGPLGVVALGGKLLGFDEDRMMNGMGIAYSQCSCSGQGYAEGALTVRLLAGLAAKAGVLAVVLSERDFTGPKNVLQGQYGLFPLYARGEYDESALTSDLGKRFEVSNISIKPYPCCNFTHRPICGVLELIKKEDVKPEEIEEIVIDTSSYAYSSVVGVNSEERARKYEPQNVVDAQFSIPYTVATAALKGQVSLDDFTEEAIRDLGVLKLAKKVNVRIDPEIDKRGGGLTPNRVEIRTKSNKSYFKYIEYIKGHPKNPMNMAECAEKFRDCARVAAKTLPEANIEKVIRMIGQLEQIDDVAPIVKLLVA